MSISKEEHPLYEDILELNKLIEEKNLETIASKELALTPPVEKLAEDGVDISQIGVHPGMGIWYRQSDEQKLQNSLNYQNNLEDLNSLIDQKTSLQEEQYRDMYSDIPTDFSDKSSSEYSKPTEPYAAEYGVEDLINTYRTNQGMDSYTDEQILDYVKYANPEQYNAVVGDSESSEFSDESLSKVGFWGAYNLTQESTSNMMVLAEKYGVPAVLVLSKEAAVDGVNKGWRTGDKEKDINTLMDILSETNDFELKDLQNLTYEQKKLKLLEYKDAVDSPEFGKLNSFALDMLTEYKKGFHEYSKNDVEFQALTQHLEETGYFFDDDGRFVLDEHIGKAIGGVVGSILGAKLAGWGFNQTKNMMLDFVGVLTRFLPLNLKAAGAMYMAAKPHIKTALTIPATGLGQMAFGYEHEAASYLTEAFMDMSQDKIHTSDEFQSALTEQTEIFRQIKNKDGNKITESQVNARLDHYVGENFEFRPDGTIIRKAMEDMDRISDALVYGMIQYGSGASVIEWLDVLFKKGGLAPEYIIKMARQAKSVKKLSQFARSLPYIENWSDIRKLKPGDSGFKNIGNKGLDFFKNFSLSATEPIEEISQTFLQQVIQTNPNTKYEIGADLNSKLGFRQNIWEPGLGGMFGGGAINLATNIPNTVGDISGINDYIANRKVENLYKNSDNSKMFVEQVASNDYRVVQMLSEIDEKTGQVNNKVNRDLKLKDPTNGTEFITRHLKRQDAQAVADAYNFKSIKKNEENLAAANLWMNEIEEFTILERNGKFEVNALNKKEVKKPEDLIPKGPVKELKSAGIKIGVYKNRKDAKNKVGELNQVLERVKSTVNSKSYNKVESIRNNMQSRINKVLDNTEQSENKNGLKFLTEPPAVEKNFNNVTEDWLNNKIKNKKLLTESHGRILIKGYMRDKKVIKNGKETSIKLTNDELAIWEIMTQEGFSENPQFIADNARAYQEILIEEGINPEMFMEDFSQDFDNYEEYLNIDQLNHISNFEDDTKIDLSTLTLEEQAIAFEEEETVTEVGSLIDRFKQPVPKTVKIADQTKVFKSIKDKTRKDVSSTEIIERFESLTPADALSYIGSEIVTLMRDNYGKEAAKIAEDARQKKIDEGVEKEAPKVKRVKKKAPKPKKKPAKEFIDKETGKPVKNIDPGQGMVDDIAFMAYWKEELPKLAREININSLMSLKDRPGFGKEKIAVLNQIFNERVTTEEKKVTKKKAPEGKEDMVTIPGTFETEGKPETMTRKEAEQRLKDLEEGSAVTGEEGVDDQMLVEDEIKALREGLAEKKAPEIDAKKVEKDFKKAEKQLKPATDIQGQMAETGRSKKDAKRFKGDKESGFIGETSLSRLNQLKEVVLGNKPAFLMYDRYANRELFKKLALENGLIDIQAEPQEEEGPYIRDPDTDYISETQVTVFVKPENIIGGMALAELMGPDYPNYYNPVEYKDHIVFKDQVPDFGAPYRGKIADLTEAEYHREVGELLGYPKEMIDSFIKNLGLKVPEIKTETIKETQEMSEVYANREDDLQLSDEQKKALNIIIGKPLGEPVIVGGYAGTGKTTIVENIATTYLKAGYTVILAAPTNKAVINIKDRLPAKILDNYEGENDQLQLRTLQTTLYEVTKKEDEGDKLIGAKQKKYYEQTVIIVDESSMIGWENYMILLQNAVELGAKVIFMGDGFQLPPVDRSSWIKNKDILQNKYPDILQRIMLTGEKDYERHFSVLKHVFNKPDIVLEQVFRQLLKSSLYRYVTALRVANKGGEFNIPFIPKPGRYNDIEGSGRLGVTNDREAFKNHYWKLLKQGKDVVLIVAKNSDRMRYNYETREEYLNSRDLSLDSKIMQSGKDGIISYEPNNPIKKGERLIGISNTTHLKNSELLNINEKPENVKKIIIKKKGKWNKQKKAYDTEYLTGYSASISYKNLTGETKEGIEEETIIVVPSFSGSGFPVNEILDIADFVTKESIFEEYEDKIDADELSQKKRRSVRKTIPVTTYAYAITGHKSQGSQWDTVFMHIDYVAVNRMGANWIYTAATRAEKTLIIYDELNNQEVQKDWKEITKLSSNKKYMLERKKATSQTINNKAETKKYTKMMFDKFEGKIPYSFVDNPNLRNSSGRYVSAYYDTKTKKIIVNLAYATPTTAFHEYLHPFFIDMAEQNPLLYEKLVKDILNTNEGKKLLLDVFDIYKTDLEDSDADEFNSEDFGEIVSIMIDIDTLKNSYDTLNEINPEQLYKFIKKYDDFIQKQTGEKNKIADELLAIATSEQAFNLIPDEKSKFRKTIDRIINWIKNKLFGPNWSINVYARAMDMNTNFSDIAKLLANSERKFGLEFVDKKLLTSRYDFDINNRYKFAAHIEKELELYDPSKENKQWLNNFYNSVWDLAGEVGYTEKEIFAAVMVGDDALLKESFHDSFFLWYRSKFNVSKKPDFNEEYTGKDNVYDIAKTVIDDNQSYLDKIEHNVAKDQKDLNPDNLFTLSAFNIQLTSFQLNRIVKIAKNNVGNFDEFVKTIFSKGEILYGKKSDMVGWKKDELLQFFLTLNSSTRTNRGEKNNQQVINYELGIQIADIDEKTKKRTYDFTINKKDSDKKLRARVYSPELGKYIYDENKSNAGWQKKTLIDALYFSETAEKMGLFGWLSGPDIKRISVKEQPDVEEGYVKNIFSIYGFLKEDELLQLDEYLMKNNLTIAFSKGDSDKIAIVKIKKEHKDHAATKTTLKNYLKKEIEDGYLKREQAITVWTDKNYDSMKKRAGLIATHEALKVIWPKYALDKGEGPNVYKRLKIPFTPITNNPEMRPIRIIKFNPKDVLFQYGENEAFSPMKLVKGKEKLYIGDGESISSKRLFKDFNNYFGLAEGTEIAKTVQYLKVDDDTYALKHLHIRAKKGWKITDKKGNNLFKITGTGNIYLGSAHPLYNDKENEKNYVDQLDTRDEIKIGGETVEDDGFNGIFEKNIDDNNRKDELTIPGAAVGFIKYEEGQENRTIHFQQWWNHLTNPELIKYFEQHYAPIAEKGVRDALRVVIDGKKTSAEKIASLTKALQTRNKLGRIPTLIDLVSLGAGKHLQTASLVDRLVQKQHVSPALQLKNMNGSTYNVAMDVTGTLQEGEISISRKGATEIIKRYRAANDGIDIKGISNEEISAWLKENPVYVAVTRFPVPHESGMFMAKVVSIHGRQAVAEMNVVDVKYKIEGDNDGDHIVVEYLPTEEMTRDFVEHMNTLKLTPLSLKKFIDPKKSKDIFAYGNKHKLIARLTAGKRAIGEVANIQAAYGSIRQIYESFSHKESLVEIIPRQPNEIIEVDIYYNGKMGWRGTVADYLRLMLQASVDNGKYGLLGEWNYNRESVILNLFKYKKGSREIDPDDYPQGIAPVFEMHVQANKIRNGEDFKNGIYSFQHTLKLSQQYLDYTRDRQGFLQNKGTYVKIKNNALTPIEMLSVAPAKILEEMNVKYNFFGTEISPYIIDFNLQFNSHVEAMLKMDEVKESLLEKASEKDNQPANLNYIMKEVAKGISYADDMGTQFSLILDAFTELGPQSMDYNDRFVKFKENYHTKFKDLSNIAKMSATYRWLEGYEITKIDMVTKKPVTQKNNIHGKYLPPVSERAGQVSLLDAGIIKKYFAQFNKQVKIVQNFEESAKDKKRWRNYRSLIRVAKEACNVKM